MFLLLGQLYLLAIDDPNPVVVPPPPSCVMRGGGGELVFNVLASLLMQRA